MGKNEENEINVDKWIEDYRKIEGERGRERERRIDR
jgi:hypothetical protein